MLYQQCGIERSPIWTCVSEREERRAPQGRTVLQRFIPDDRAVRGAGGERRTVEIMAIDSRRAADGNRKVRAADESAVGRNACGLHTQRAELHVAVELPGDQVVAAGVHHARLLEREG